MSPARRGERGPRTRGGPRSAGPYERGTSRVRRIERPTPAVRARAGRPDAIALRRRRTHPRRTTWSATLAALGRRVVGIVAAALRG